MKKLLLVAVLGVFMLGIVACGGPSMESFAKDMVKATDTYVEALGKVESKEDLIKAMKAYTVVMKDLKVKGKDLMKADPKAMAEFGKSETAKKMMASMMKLGPAMMNKNVMKFMADPEIQKLSKELNTASK